MPIGIYLGTQLGRGGARSPITFLAVGNSLAAQDRNGAVTLTGSGALRYQPGSGGRVNYALNPRFANDISNWAAYNTGTMTRLTDTDFSGGIAAETSGPITDSGSAMLTTGAALMAASPLGATFTISFDAKLVSGATDWRVTITERTAAGTQSVLSTIPVTIASPAVTRITVPYTLTGTGIHRLTFRLVRASATAGTVRFSNTVIEAGTVANPAYFDGASAGCAWADPITGVAGTAHASPSISRAAFWVEEATTNLLPNPSGESGTLNLSGANLTVGTDVTSDSAYGYVGSKAWKTVTKGLLADEGFTITSATGLAIAGGGSYIGSLYLRGSGTVKAQLVVNYTDASSSSSPYVTLALSDTWQRLITDAVASTGGKTVDSFWIRVRNNATSVITFWADAAQVEAKSYATSYCDGSLGTGYSWSGAAHASTSTRTVTSISTAVGSRVSPVTGSMVAVGQRTFDRGTSQTALTPGTFGTNDWVQCGVGSGDKLFTQYKVNAGTAQTALVAATNTPGVWFTLLSDWVGTTIGISSLTDPRVTATRDASSGTIGGNINIGTDGSTPFGGLLGPVAIFDRVLTASELTTLSASEPSGWWAAI